jgi:hypothetical protein
MDQWQVRAAALRYVGREADGKTLLAASLSEVEVEQVKLYGPLFVLHHLANEIQLAISELHVRAIQTLP